MNTENQIPFSWDLYRQGKHDVITRNGHKVTDLEDGYSWDEYPIKGNIEVAGGTAHGTAVCWTKDGKFTVTISGPHPLDLFLIEKETTNG